MAAKEPVSGTKDKTTAPTPQGRAEPPFPLEPSRTVREWTAALEARPSVVAGAGYLAGWKADTPLTRAEFEAGVAAYENTPMGGHEAQPKAR